MIPAGLTISWPTFGVIVASGFVCVFLLWCVSRTIDYACRLNEIPPGPPANYCEHVLSAHPESLDYLECRHCSFTMRIPRGAPRSPTGRFLWLRAHGLLYAQEGRSVAFCEALRGCD